jgi:hypothetical protein
MTASLYKNNKSVKGIGGNGLCFCQNQTQHTNADVSVERQTAHAVTNGL